MAATVAARKQVLRMHLIAMQHVALEHIDRLYSELVAVAAEPDE
ncbi:hypothetical protein [Nocardia goodfellowii]|uniref:MarR family transcriptional regulator n=1 Tax=Nocardia goodfellowii TaxID=882446 RepID=A0ABS4QPD2_9NOCA|nr:hypothetical protein [Nocardia goodfellowii]MBP2192953.1 hypothetical protein [Nocardia goodfellowii]